MQENKDFHFDSCRSGADLLATGFLVRAAAYPYRLNVPAAEAQKPKRKFRQTVGELFKTAARIRELRHGNSQQQEIGYKNGYTSRYVRARSDQYSRAQMFTLTAQMTHLHARPLSALTVKRTFVSGWMKNHQIDHPRTIRGRCTNEPSSILRQRGPKFSIKGGAQV